MIYYDRINKFLENAKSIEQTSKFHLENLYIHTLLCADYLLKQTNSKIFVLAGLLHDTGKIETRKYKEGKGWTFYGHARVSAKKLKYFISEDDPLYKFVYDLVFCHMVFYECNNKKESELKFLVKYGHSESFYNNLQLFNSGDENACIRDEKFLKENKNYDTIKNRIFQFLKN